MPLSYTRFGITEIVTDNAANRLAYVTKATQYALISNDNLNTDWTYSSGSKSRHPPLFDINTSTPANIAPTDDPRVKSIASYVSQLENEKSITIDNGYDEERHERDLVVLTIV